MAITAFPAPMWMPANATPGFNSTSYTTRTMDASGERVAFIVQAPKTGTLHSFECRMGGFTQCTNGLRFSFQDVDTATGNPDLVADQYRDVTAGLATNAWLTPPGPLTSDGTGAGTKRSVTRGEWLACVVDFVSFAASDSLAIANTLFGGIEVSSSATYVVSYTPGIVKADSAHVLALKYDDGTYAHVCEAFTAGPWASLALTGYSSGSTPDERGVRFVLAVETEVVGLWVNLDLDNAADLVLYDSGGSVVTSISVGSGIRVTTSMCVLAYRLATPVTLPAGTYRFTVKPTTGFNVTIPVLTIPSSAHLGAVMTGTSWYGTSRTDGGSWTDSDTTIYPMGLIVSGVNVSGGGGGGGGGSYAFVG